MPDTMGSFIVQSSYWNHWGREWAGIFEGRRSLAVLVDTALIAPLVHPKEEHQPSPVPC